MKQSFITATMTPACMFLIIFGLWCMVQGVRQFHDARENGSFGDKLSFTAFFGGLGVTLVSAVMWCMWTIWR